MGEAKRRQKLLGDNYGQSSGKANRNKLVRWIIEGFLISFVSLAVLWITLRFFSS